MLTKFPYEVSSNNYRQGKKSKTETLERIYLKLHPLSFNCYQANQQRINQIKTFLMVFRFLSSATEERRKEWLSFQMGGTLHLQQCPKEHCILMRN